MWRRRSRWAELHALLAHALFRHSGCGLWSSEVASFGWLFSLCPPGIVSSTSKCFELQEAKQASEENEAHKGSAMEDIFDVGWHRLAWLRCGGVSCRHAMRASRHACWAALCWAAMCVASPQAGVHCES